MKVGDLVRVCYVIKDPYDLAEIGWGPKFTGIVIGVPNDGKYKVLTMWCFSTQTTHTLMPELDLIEVISENR
tara:strand:+ start:887 stop:1102 length:216 start_codon:yes stop_codon:yes gene_type:complete